MSTIMHSPFRIDGYIQSNWTSDNTAEQPEPKTDSEDPLLPQHNTDPIGAYARAVEQDSHRASQRLATIAVHAGLIALYTIAALAAISHGRSMGPERNNCFVDMAIPFSPAQDVVTYSNVIHSNWSGDPYERRYRGGPNADVDRAWEELLNPYNLRITPFELYRLNKTSLELRDGSGDYWASIEVYHHLHCLNMMRHWMAKEYYSDVMEHEKMHIAAGHLYPSHIEHCLDMLRQHLMCSPSLSFWTYGWRAENGYKEPEDDMHFEHRCVDWDQLHAWALERSFRIEDGLIRKPDVRGAGRGPWLPLLLSQAQYTEILEDEVKILSIFDRGVHTDEREESGEVEISDTAETKL